MSSGLVRSAIAAVLEDKDFRVESHRILNAKVLAEELLHKAVESEEKMDKFDSFASELMKRLEAACKEDKRLKLHSTKRKKMWSAFHKARIDTLSTLWNSMISHLGVKNDDTGRVELGIAIANYCKYFSYSIVNRACQPQTFRKLHSS